MHVFTGYDTFRQIPDLTDMLNQVIQILEFGQYSGIDDVASEPAITAPLTFTAHIKVAYARNRRKRLRIGGSHGKTDGLDFVQAGRKQQ